MLGIYLNAILKNMHQGYVSKCCYAPIKIAKEKDEYYERGKLTTNYYICTVCNKPCEVVKNKYK